MSNDIVVIDYYDYYDEAKFVIPMHEEDNSDNEEVQIAYDCYVYLGIVIID